MALADLSGEAGRVSDSHRQVSLLVAIPAYNEEKTIGSVVLMARSFASKVVVVDDGSEDETAAIAERAGATVIQHPTNRGYGAAIRSCFDYARASRAGTLVILDGDGQHRPGMIPQVVTPIREGRADVTIGSRFLDGIGSKYVPGYRKFGILLITKLTNLGLRRSLKLTDAQSGFRAYSREAIEAIDPFEANMGASTEVLLEAARKGLRIMEVPITVDYRPGHPPRSPMKHGLSVVGSIVRYVEAKHALLFFSLPGFILFLGGLALGFHVVDIFYRSNGVLAIGSALITVLLIVLGTMLAFTGLILHAVINASPRIR